MNLSVRPENFKQIDMNVSRSAQPNETNILWLKENGVTDIINFRTLIVPDLIFDEAQFVKENNMVYHSIPSVSRTPTYENVGRFLDIVENVKSQKGKIHIHCKQGADRTGMYAYIYETLKEIGSEGSRIIEFFKHGYHYDTYPNLIDWANNFIKNYKFTK